MSSHQFGRVLLVGGSRGIGAAAAQALSTQCEELLSVSRTPAVAGRWIKADLAEDEGLDRVVAAVGDDRLDALLYLGGIWEDGAFTSAYDFAASPRAETRRVIAVNLVAPILLAQALIPAFRRARAPRLVLRGALSALPNAATREVANTASKAGLAGAAEALSLALGPEGIAVTLLHPGNVATPEVEDDIASGRFDPQTPIPLADLTETVLYALRLSSAARAGVLTLHQTGPFRQ
jgi:NAD(P)-dependent dehydrogenase (short-subunit alcohol dehydrogenase family)